MKSWMKKIMVVVLGAAVLVSIKPLDTLENHTRLAIQTAGHVADSLSFKLRPQSGTGTSAALLLDLSTGETLYAKNADKPLPPASMSKMMTEYLVLEQIKSGALKWEDKVEISAYAASAVGSKVPLREGARVSVRDLLAAVAIQSANDAAIALAEHVAGSEEQFAAWMNHKADILDLSLKSQFINATGLSRKDMGTAAPSSLKGEQRMTARDTARLAAKLLKDYPEILEYSNLPFYRMEYRGITLTSTNLMLQDKYRSTLYVKGMDGLKTGFTNEAGYCFTGTAVVNGKRYVSVVMGTSSSLKRFEETKKLLAFGTADDNKGNLGMVETDAKDASHELTLGL